MIEKLAEALQMDTIELFSVSNQKKEHIVREKASLMQRISNEIDMFIEQIDTTK